MVTSTTTADPAGAERTIELLSASSDAVADRLESDRALRAALAAVAGASPWLARICISRPEAALDVIAAVEDAQAPWEKERATHDEPHARLVTAKELGTLWIATRDLVGYDDLEHVGARLSSLAGHLLETALDAAGLDTPGLGVIGMGKLGAEELNYASDIDLLLVSEHGDDGDGGGNGNGNAGALRTFLDLARTAWRVDLDLRPEGRAGALTRSVASYRAYWRRWADVWEFQALIKARPVAGDPALGKRFADAAADALWERPLSTDDLRRLRDLKARSERELQRRGLSDRELKRGPGGIRDIEFALQLLQLVHGHADETLRVRSTFEATAALAAGGYIAPDDAATLEAAYRFLRTVEHRIQIYEGEQAHALPVSVPRREHLARVLGYRARGSTSAAEQLEADLRHHRSAARAIHERLFFRPLLEVFGAGRALAREDTTESVSLDERAVADRLAAFGFADAVRTRQAVTELTRGFSRVSRLMQQTLPILLDWLSATPDPDEGLLGLRTLAGEPLSRDGLVAVCRESPIGARQLCTLLGTTSRFARDFQRYPAALGELATGAFLRRSTPEELDARIERSLAWRSAKGAAEAGLRSFATAERLRIAGRDVLEVEEPGPALSDLADAVLDAALRRVEAGVPIAVIGMGRLGGRELGHGSDLDLLFVYDTPPGVVPSDGAAIAEDAVSALMRIVAGTTPATGAYRVDLSLRPEGRQGPAARSIDSYAAYYGRWAEPWERQALLRGRFVAGDANLGDRFAALARDFVRGHPLSSADVVDIRRTKARMERERVPAGEDPKFHLKLGPGSLSDVEWTAQLLQLKHGIECTGTLDALAALTAAGVLAGADAEILVDAYRFCERCRNRLSLIRDFPTDSLPTTGHQLSVLARSLGSTSSELRNEYARRTRRARRVVERLFYGKERG